MLYRNITICFVAIVGALVKTSVTSAFSMLRSPSRTTVSPVVAISLSLSTLDTQNRNDAANSRASLTFEEDEELQEARQELIQKYLTFGKSLDEAESEIDAFLLNPERSRKYLEMRRYNKSQKDLGFESPLMFLAAFCLGLIGNYFFHFLNIDSIFIGPSVPSS